MCDHKELLAIALKNVMVMESSFFLFVYPSPTIKWGKSHIASGTLSKQKSQNAKLRIVLFIFNITFSVSIENEQSFYDIKKRANDLLIFMTFLANRILSGEIDRMQSRIFQTNLFLFLNL